MQTTTIESIAPPGQLLFLPGAYNDTLELLTEAQDYFSYYGPEDQKLLNQTERLLYTNEMSRITLRLSAVMAWLLARRAVGSGALSEDTAARQYALQFHPICLQETVGMEYVLPETMCRLLSRTRDLYQRIARLDDMTTRLN